MNSDHGSNRHPTTPLVLPIDPDLGDDEPRSSRPVHLRPAALVVVLAGGTFGTAAREALSLAFPPVAGIPYTVFAINVGGALLLGMLLASLAQRGPDRGGRRMLRLLLGTGFLGGFTTYSALASDAAQLIGGGAAVTGIGYAIGTLVVGGIATWCGIALAAALHRGSSDATEESA